MIMKYLARERAHTVIKALSLHVFGVSREFCCHCLMYKKSVFVPGIGDMKYSTPYSAKPVKEEQYPEKTTSRYYSLSFLVLLFWSGLGNMPIKSKPWPVDGPQVSTYCKNQHRNRVECRNHLAPRFTCDSLNICTSEVSAINTLADINHY